MPRTKLSASTDADKLLCGTIRKYLSIKDKSVTDCAPLCGITTSTLYDRLKSLRKFSISELFKLRKTLGIPQDELLDVLQKMM